MEPIKQQESGDILYLILIVTLAYKSLALTQGHRLPT